MALQDKDRIKDLFASKLHNMEVDVPDSIWAGIEQALPEEPLVAARPHTRRITLRRIMTVAASLVGVVIITSTFLFISNPDDASNRMGVSFGNGKLVYDPSNNREAALPEEAAAKLQRPYDAHVSNNAYTKQVFAKDLIKPQTLIIDNPDLLLCDVKESDKNVAIVIKNNSTQPARRQLATLPPVVLPGKANKNRENLALNLNGGSGLLAANANQQGALMPFTTKNHPDIAGEPTFRDNIIDLEHNQPISFGLTVSKQLSSRFSIETGITYTYLSSKFKTIDSDAVDEKINFHYLGVPLNVNYTFLQLGKANFYASAGVEMEKDIQGRYNSTLVNIEIPKQGINNASTNSLSGTVKSNFSSVSENEPGYATSRVKKNIHQNNLQFSAQMSIGASFPIYQKLYVYGNIGGTYYFDADNEYPTIYSDKKTQLDLNLGLKLKF